MYAILKSNDPQTIKSAFELAANWVVNDDYYPFQWGSNAGTLQVSREGLFRGIPHHEVTPAFLLDQQLEYICWTTCYGNHAKLEFSYLDGKAVAVELTLEGKRNGLPVWGMADQNWQVVEYSTNASFLHPLQRMQDWLKEQSSEQLLEQLVATPGAFGGVWLAEDALAKLGVRPGVNPRALSAQFNSRELAVIRRLLAATNDLAA